MRLVCPYCGERDHSEFGYRGDAGPKRPPLRSLARGQSQLPPAGDAMIDYVHMRDNPAGRIRELWHHSGGCRAWLVVERDVTTHEIGTVRLARTTGTDAR